MSTPPRTLAVLLRDPFLALTAELTARLAEGAHPEVRPAHGSLFGFLDDAGTRLGLLAERAQVTRQSMAEVEARWAAPLGERGLRDLRRPLERIQPE